MSSVLVNTILDFGGQALLTNLAPAASSNGAVTLAQLTAAIAAANGQTYSETIGNGSSVSIVVQHNLNSLDTQVYMREVSGDKRQIITEVQHTSVNSVTVLFKVAPIAGSIKIIVKT